MVYRIVNESDAAQYLAFFIAVVSETDNLASSPEEVKKLTVDDERAFIKASSDSGSFSMAAFDGEVICGSCDIRISVRPRTRHRAEMGISVLRKYWGTVVARILLASALDEAAARGVRKVELTVRADNERAKAFYRKNGFAYAGRDSMLLYIDGRYIDGERYEILL